MHPLSHPDLVIQRQKPVCFWSHDPAVQRSHGAMVLRSYGPITIVLLALVALASSARAQIRPLQDVVPLGELEIRTGDLINLATSLSDAVQERKSAQLSVQTLQKLQPSVAVTGLEMQIAQLNVEAAENKVRILRAIAESQLGVARAKLEFLRRIANNQNGTAQVDAANPHIQQAQAIVQILQLILEIK